MTNQQFQKRPFERDEGRNKKYKGTGKGLARKNEKIRAKEVRVIGNDGKQLGIMQLNEAIFMAKQLDLDLVEISHNAVPPVCKILNFGKYKYDESKKSKGTTKQASAKIKEIKLRVAIDPNDYNTKMRRAMEFLDDGNKLKLSLIFRGRELAHTDLGFELVKKFIADIKSHGIPDSEPKMLGKAISLTMSPCLKKKPKISSEKQGPEELNSFGKLLDVSELLKLH